MDFGWILDAKLESENGHVGSKTARCPAKRIFLGTKKGNIFNAKKSIRPRDFDPRTFSAQDPLVGLPK